MGFEVSRDPAFQVMLATLIILALAAVRAYFSESVVLDSVGDLPSPF